MAFHYRFSNLLQLRRRQRDEAGAAVAQVHQALQRVDEQIEAVHDERRTLRDEANRKRLGQVSVDDLLVHGRYDLQLQARLQSLTATKGELNQELQRRQIALVTAETEVKRFEKLEEREQATFRKQLLQRHQAESDDANQSRTIMGRMRQ